MLFAIFELWQLNMRNDIYRLGSLAVLILLPFLVFARSTFRRFCLIINDVSFERCTLLDPIVS